MFAFKCLNALLIEITFSNIYFLNILSVLSPVPGGAYPLHIWASEIPWRDHSQPGAICASLQRGAALGGDRAVPLRGPGETSHFTQEVHKDCCSVRIKL